MERNPPTWTWRGTRRRRPRGRWAIAGLSLAAWLSSSTPPAQAQTPATWIGGTGNWSRATGWNPNLVPNNGSPTPDATYRVTVGSGTVTQDINPGVTLSGLNLTSGTITGGNLTIDGPLAWSGGTMAGTGTTILHGPAAISGAVLKTLSRTVENHGVATHSSDLDASAGAVWTNAAGSLFDITGIGSLWRQNASDDPIFQNAAGATLRKSGAGASFIAWNFHNAGTVDVQAGTLSFYHGGTGQGAFQVASGATLGFGGGIHTLGADATLSGPGTVAVTNGTLNVAGASLRGVGTVAVTGFNTSLNLTGATMGRIGALNFNTGTISGEGNLTIDGPLAWSGGTMAGTGTTILHGPTALTGNATTTLARAVENHGVATFSGNILNLNAAAGAVWTNAAGSLFNITAAGSLGVFGGPGARTFDNAAGATFRKSGTGTSSVAWSFRNAGLIEAVSGTTRFTGAFSQSETGTLLAGESGILRFNSALDVQGDLAGSGAIVAPMITHSHGSILPGGDGAIGTLTLDADLILSASSVLSFDLSSPALSDQLFVDGDLTLNGILDIHASSGLELGSYRLIALAGTLTNNGLALGTTPEGYLYELVVDAANALVLLNVAVPEPGSLILVGLGGLGLVAVGYRRSRDRTTA